MATHMNSGLVCRPQEAKRVGDIAGSDFRSCADNLESNTTIPDPNQPAPLPRSVGFT